MRRLAVAAALLAALAGCGWGAAPAAPEPPPRAQPEQRPPLPVDQEQALLDADNFTADIGRNRYHPMPPGSIREYRRTVTVKGKTEILTRKVLVTRRTKQLPNRIKAAVIESTLYTAKGVLRERVEHYLFAHRDTGDIWYGGRQSRFGRSFQAGGADAEAGIVALDAPQPGDEYRVEWIPGERPVQRKARVLSVGQTVRVPAFPKPLPDCVLIEEWSPFTPNVELQTHCPLIGLVLTTLVSAGDDRRMTEELIKARRP